MTLRLRAFWVKRQRPFLADNACDLKLILTRSSQPGLLFTNIIISWLALGSREFLVGSPPQRLGHGCAPKLNAHGVAAVPTTSTRGAVIAAGQSATRNQYPGSGCDRLGVDVLGAVGIARIVSRATAALFRSQSRRRRRGWHGPI